MADDFPFPISSGQWSEDHLQNRYEEYTIRSSYLYRSGCLQTPVAAEGEAESELIQITAPWGQKTVQWTATREGAPPVIPDPEPQQSDLCLHSHEVHQFAPRLGVDGETRVYSASGTYVYNMKTPIKAGTSILRLGKPPYDISSADSHVVGPESISSDLL